LILVFRLDCLHTLPRQRRTHRARVGWCCGGWSTWRHAGGRWSTVLSLWHCVCCSPRSWQSGPNRIEPTYPVYSCSLDQPRPNGSHTSSADVGLTPATGSALVLVRSRKASCRAFLFIESPITRRRCSSSTRPPPSWTARNWTARGPVTGGQGEVRRLLVVDGEPVVCLRTTLAID
jgi:hypothetical protein